MVTECKYCGKSDVSLHTKTANGKKQRYKCNNKSCAKTFVIGDGRQKKAGVLDKFTMMLLSQPKENLSHKQIGALFKMEKQSIGQIIKAWPKAEEGIPIELDLKDVVCEILPDWQIRERFIKEINAHNHPDWIILKFHDIEGSHVTYVLKAIDEDSGKEVYRSEEYFKQDALDPSIRIQRIEKLASMLHHGYKRKTLMVILEHGPCNYRTIKDIMKAHRPSLTRALDDLERAGFIETTYEGGKKYGRDKKYGIRWTEFEYFSKVFSKPESRRSKAQDS
jgi:transposase-like protein/DNA-binding transcriptional ArsR family regulator